MKFNPVAMPYEPAPAAQPINLAPLGQSPSLEKNPASTSITLAKPGQMTSVQEYDFAKQYGINLSEQEKKTINDYSKMIDISNSQHVAFYGADSQRKIADFSDQTLGSIKTKDLGEISTELTGLVTQLTTMSGEQPKGFFSKLFRKAETNLAEIKANYDSTAKNVEKITRSLEDHQVKLIQDISMFDQMYQLNLEYFKELTMYIIAGKQALENAKNTTGAELRAKAEASGLPEDAQAYSDFNALCDRFDKKLFDLELTRNQSLQMSPQIRLLQGNDQTLVDKIQTVIVNTIPVWKNQMVLALGLANSQKAMAAQRAVTDATNSLMRKNAEMLHMGSIDVARENERGVIDLETLKETNKHLIDTLTDIQKIQSEGREKRLQAEAELQQIEGELKTKLMEMSNPVRR